MYGKEKWDRVKKNEDEIGQKVLLFAETWARLMQYALSEGDVFDDEIIKECAELADEHVGGALNGSGYRYDYAREVLKGCWAYWSLLY